MKGIIFFSTVGICSVIQCRKVLMTEHAAARSGEPAPLRSSACYRWPGHTSLRSDVCNRNCKYNGRTITDKILHIPVRENLCPSAVCVKRPPDWTGELGSRTLAAGPLMETRPGGFTPNVKPRRIKPRTAHRKRLFVKQTYIYFMAAARLLFYFGLQ